jgi:glycine dehydrogenase subunit 1
MNYTSHSKIDISNMLRTIGVSSIKDLFSDIPKNLILDKLNIQHGMNEQEILIHLNNIAKKNKILISFRGVEYMIIIYLL